MMVVLRMFWESLVRWFRNPYSSVVVSGLLIIPLLLLIPLIAMQFSTDVQWTGGDFLVMGALLTGIGLTAEYALRKIKTRNGRILALALLLAVFLLIWAELAVGIFGTPFAGS